MKKQSKGTYAVLYLILFFLFLVEVIPIAQVFLNSFRTDAEVKTMPFGLPKNWTFANWPETWVMGEYGIAFINSLITASVVILTVLTVVGLGAYALSKLQFSLRGFFTAYFFVAISLPGFLYIVPDYFLFSKIGLMNTRFALILIYTASSLPFNMLLLRTFLGGIPRELEEAAKIDGCTELGVFLRITVPIAKTIFLTIAILVFVGTWNEFLWANTFIQDEALKPVSTRYVKFVGQYSSNMARIYTASAITILPIILLYILFSRRFIEGMTSGSVKG
jgi:raffinose/stachyose/melibiose transport system permease protein